MVQLKRYCAGVYRKINCFLAFWLCLAFVETASAGNYFERIKEQEAAIQVSKKQFRFVQVKESFPERINASQEIRVVSNVKATLITLHDFDTGKPLESCLSPCTLHGQSGQKYAVVFFKLGHFPKVQGMKVDGLKTDIVIKKQMGINYFKAKFEHQKCRKEFKEFEDFEREPEPCYRLPGVMPKRAKRSGHCRMEFDLTKTGKPVNIRPVSCSDDIFESPSRAAISWWRYHPEISQGMPVSTRNIETKMTFKLKNKDGNLIPEGAQ